MEAASKLSDVVNRASINVRIPSPVTLDLIFRSRSIPPTYDAYLSDLSPKDELMTQSPIGAYGNILLTLKSDECRQQALFTTPIPVHLLASSRNIAELCNHLALPYLEVSLGKTPVTSIQSIYFLSAKIRMTDPVVDEAKLLGIPVFAITQSGIELKLM
jgi:hypothetical protein